MCKTENVHKHMHASIASLFGTSAMTSLSVVSCKGKRTSILLHPRRTRISLPSQPRS